MSRRLSHVTLIVAGLVSGCCHSELDRRTGSGAGGGQHPLYDVERYRENVEHDFQLEAPTDPVPRSVGEHIVPIAPTPDVIDTGLSNRSNQSLSGDGNASAKNGSIGRNPAIVDNRTFKFGKVEVGSDLPRTPSGISPESNISGERKSGIFDLNIERRVDDPRPRIDLYGGIRGRMYDGLLSYDRKLQLVLGYLGLLFDQDVLGGRYFFGGRSALVGFEQILDLKQRDDEQKYRDDRQNGGEKADRICPQPFPEPTMVFGISAAVFAFGMYVQWRNFVAAVEGRTRDSWLGGVVATLGLIACLATLMGNWWSGIGCAAWSLRP